MGNFRLATFVLILTLGFPALAAETPETMGAPPSAENVPDYLRTSEHISVKKDFKKQSNVTAFLQAAINKSMWEDLRFSNLEINYVPGVSREDSFYNPEYVQKHYPWIYPLIFPITEVPNYMAISKWTKPIRISLGLPNDAKPYNVPLHNGKPVTEDPRWPNVFKDDKSGDLVFSGALLYGINGSQSKQQGLPEIIADEAALLAPGMARLTGLDVSYVADEPENPENISNMRIVLMNRHHIGWLTEFKKGPMTTVGTGIKLRRGESVSLHDLADHRAIHFTPLYGIYQVEGFYIANKKNEIEFSVCYITDNLEDEELFRKLVRECLIRSLGLPDLQSSLKQSYTYAWNGQLKDKKERDAIKNALMEVLGEEKAKILLYSNLTYIFSQGAAVEGLITGSPNFNEADEYFIKTLYSDEIKPGMNYLEAYQALMTGN